MLVKDEIRQECFFASRHITDDNEKEAWKKTGLSVPQSRIAYDRKGWRNLGDPETFSEIENGKVKYNPEVIPGKRVSIKVILTDCDMEQEKEMLKLWIKINGADNLETLRHPAIKNIRDIYQESETNFNWGEMEKHWKKKELELFKANFEADSPSSIATDLNLSPEQKNECYQKWLDQTHGEGRREREWLDNDWEPEELHPSLFVSAGFHVEFPNIINPRSEEVEIIRSIDPSQIKKGQLEIAQGLLVDINSKTTAGELVDYNNHKVIANSGLDNRYLSNGWKKGDIQNFLYAKWKKLDQREFTEEVKDEYRDLTSNPLPFSPTDNQIYNFRFRKTVDNKTKWLNAEWVAKWLRGGWIDWNNPDIISVDEAGVFWAEIEGWKFDPDKFTFDEATKELWIEKFVNGIDPHVAKRPLPTLSPTPSDSSEEAIPRVGGLLDRDRIIEYRKNDIPAEKSRQVFENGWESDDFNWDGSKANISSHNSFGETDTNFCGTEVSKSELDKVNENIKKIKEAKKITDLISESEALNYDEKKVPQNKEKIQVREIFTARYNELERLHKEAKIQPDITEIETELNKKPVISVQNLTNSDYRSQLSNLADQDTEREAYKKKVIAEIKAKRNELLESIRAKITNAENIFKKNDTTQQELEKAVNDLKNISKALSDSAEKIVWAEKETENQKLLNDLEEKLSKFTPPRNPDKENFPPPPASNQPLTPEQKEVYGEDWKVLKPVQQETRQAIVKKWEEVKQKTHQESCCSACKKAFVWDKNLSHLEAQKKVLAEIENHQKTCSLKNSNRVKKITQEEWEETRKTKSRNFYSCPHCWEKIIWDKSITDVEQTKKQASADWKLHVEECHKPKNERTIKVLSENQNIQHASLNYAEGFDESKTVLERDNQGEIWQEQIGINANKPVDWTPWIVGGGVLLIGGILLLNWLFNQPSKIIRKKRIA